MTKQFLRILLWVVGVAFILLLIFGFSDILAVFRSRAVLLLLLGPLVGVFVWSVYGCLFPKEKPKRVRRKREQGGKWLDL